MPYETAFACDSLVIFPYATAPNTPKYIVLKQIYPGSSVYKYAYTVHCFKWKMSCFIQYPTRKFCPLMPAFVRLVALGTPALFYNIVSL